MERYFRLVIVADDGTSRVEALALRQIEAFGFARTYNAHAETHRAELYELDLDALAAVPGVPCQPVSRATRMASSSDRSA